MNEYSDAIASIKSNVAMIRIALATSMSLVLVMLGLIATTPAVAENGGIQSDLVNGTTVVAATTHETAAAREVLDTMGLSSSNIVKREQSEIDTRDEVFDTIINDKFDELHTILETPSTSTVELTTNASAELSNGENNVVENATTPNVKKQEKKKEAELHGEDKSKNTTVTTTNEDLIFADGVYDIALLEDCSMLLIPDTATSNIEAMKEAVVAETDNGVIAKYYSMGDIVDLALETQMIKKSDVAKKASAAKNEEEAAADMAEYLVGTTIAYCAVVDGDALSSLSLDAIPDDIAHQITKTGYKRMKTNVDDKMWFDQNAYPGQYYQDSYDIPTYGCGLCATTCAVNMLLNKKYEPPEIAAKMEAWADANGGIQYCVNQGTAYAEWVEVVSGVFDLEIRKAESIEDLEASLAAGAVAVSGHDGAFRQSGGGMYYTGGHIICLYKTKNGSIWAKDSAGEWGGPCIEYSPEEFETYWQGSGYRTYILSRPSC